MWPSISARRPSPAPASAPRCCRSCARTSPFLTGRAYSFAAPPTPIEPPGTTDRGDVKTLAALANAYYDFPNFAGFTPYVRRRRRGARRGLGTTTLSSNADGRSVATLSGATTTQFAWQASAGVSYSIIPAVALDIGYRYFDAGEGRSGNTVTIGGVTAAFPVQRGNIHAHEIQVGIRVGFERPHLPGVNHNACRREGPAVSDPGRWRGRR